MIDSSELREIQKRIQVIEDNLRQLQEQATALSGAADEERIASRIADQEAKLAALLIQREALIGKAQSDAQEWSLAEAAVSTPKDKHEWLGAEDKGSQRGFELRFKVGREHKGYEQQCEIAAHDEGGPYACAPAKLDQLFSSSGPAHSGRTRGDALRWFLLWSKERLCVLPRLYTSVEGHAIWALLVGGGGGGGFGRGGGLGGGPGGFGMRRGHALALSLEKRSLAELYSAAASASGPLERFLW
jgi:hypothetical protein